MTLSDSSHSSRRQSDPIDSVLSLCRLVAVKVGLDLGLFEHLSNQGDNSIRVEDIGRAKGVDPRLIHRILRILANTNEVVETGPGLFGANEASRLWTNPNVRAACDFHYEHTFQVMLTLPAYLKKTGYSEPKDPTKAAWNFFQNSSLPFFKWLDAPENENSRCNFDKSMMVGARTHHWFETTASASQILGSASDPEAPLLVDVGGGLGEHAYRLHTRHPDLLGKLIVQDLPQSIREAKERDPPANLAFMEYDFFNTQPISGAKNYYLRRILHDWPDEEAVQILQNQKTALRKGYSRILLNEKVVPDQGASSADVVSDLVGMVVAATERTESEWRQLVARAGRLEVTSILTFEGCTEKIIIIEQQQ